MGFYPLEYYEFFIKFNEGDYYTCHDLLEDMWLLERNNLFLKGLLQMTVALYHYGYGNVKGARAMMGAADQYLQPYSPAHWGLNVEQVLEFTKECSRIIPHDVDFVPFEHIHCLPRLPHLILYLDE
jgi:predicted metal-dependent hydrolase